MCQLLLWEGGMNKEQTHILTVTSKGDVGDEGDWDDCPLLPLFEDVRGIGDRLKDLAFR